MNMRQMDRGRKKERALTATGGWHGHAARLTFTCVSFMHMWKCCSRSIGFSLSRKPPFFYPLTSNQVHIDEIWFNVSRLLWLVPQALQGERDAE